MYTNLIDELKPKPKFNLDYYKDEDLYSEGDVEDKMIQLIAQNNPEDYSKVIYDNFSWSTYYHLTHMRKNILNWYSFDSQASILEIGCGLGAITNMLCERCKSVTAVELSKKRATATLLRCRERENLEIIVGNLNDIKFKEKFDYITLIGVLEYQGQYTNTENSYVDFLNTVKKLLKPNGKLLIAIENKYGLKYWCGAREDHTGIPFDSINQYGIGNKNAKTFSKQELSQLIKNSGFQNLFFYYPMPDYKLPTVIYSEKKLPDNENMQNLQPYYLDNSTLVANEKNIYKDLIENQVFEFFANSFLVEGSDGDVGQITFANISSERLAQYRIVTRFCNNEKVEKYALEDNIGREHLVQTWKNQEALKKIGMKVWNLQLKDKVLISDYSKEQLLENKLLDSFKKKNIAEICEILDKAYYDILHSSSHIEENKNIMFELGIADEKNTKSYGPILSIGFLDMIFRNAFYKQGDLYWFDQEWILESIPAKYILYTAIVEFYQSFPQCEQVLSIKEIAQKYEIESLWDEFGQMRQMFFETVVDEYHSVTSQVFRTESTKPIMENIKKLINM